MKRKTLLFLSSSLVFTSAFFVASCSSDDDFLMGNGLDINSQVPLTRSSGGDGFIVNPNAQPWKQISKNDTTKNNKCGPWAFAEMLMKKEAPSETNTADDKFNKFDKYANDHFGTGKNLTSSQMLEMGKNFDLVDAQMDFMPKEEGSPTPIRSDFFSEHKNNTIVNYQKNGKDHWAYCTGVNKKKGSVEIVDSDGYSDIPMDQIQSVLYKK